MLMLLLTDAKIVAFEPNPDNFFCLTTTLLQMPQQLRARVHLFPIALGNVSTSTQLYAATHNMGNGVVGRIIKDTGGAWQNINAPVNISVMRFDSIFRPGAQSLPLVKMDAQGFECRILEGMGIGLASTVSLIKTEIADHWLNNQGCSAAALFDLAHEAGFRVMQYDGPQSSRAPRILNQPLRGSYDVMFDRPRRQDSSKDQSALAGGTIDLSKLASMVEIQIVPQIVLGIVVTSTDSELWPHT
jgi:FkbM family methyltransferase